MPSEFPIERVNRDRFDQASELLAAAFYDYPVMRFVIGEVEDQYPHRLAALMDFFTEARFAGNDFIHAVLEDDALAAVAYIVRPRSKATAASAGMDPLAKHRERIWTELGSESLSRYEAFGAATARYSFPEPRFHLDMLGTRPESVGRGHGRRLLDFLHTLSRCDPDSVGVSLTTEDPANVPFYEHFGYKIVGHERFGAKTFQDGAEFESWGFFRPDD